MKKELEKYGLISEDISDENIDSLASPAEKTTVEDDTVDEY